MKTQEIPIIKSNKVKSFNPPDLGRISNDLEETDEVNERSSFKELRVGRSKSEPLRDSGVYARSRRKSNMKRGPFKAWRRKRKIILSKRATFWGRHPIMTVLVALWLLLTPVWWSMGTALTNPALGTTLPARLAEWVRDHGGKSVVVWAENTWYMHHAPPVGGKPPKGSIPPPITTKSTTAPSIAYLPEPAAMVPFESNPVPGEGQWHPAGKLVNGIPAIYEAFMAPDAIHTSLVAGVAWMDTKLLKATLYSGSYIPGYGPWQNSAPISPSASTSLVAAFNAGFRMQDARGGYYNEGREVIPLKNGIASFVIYSDGSVNIGTWGSDVTMTPNVVSVRQNLVLLVNNGQPSPNLNSNDTSVWGYTLGGKAYVWRSGIGITSNGALVYAGGPGLTITSLANLLIRAGAVRAMELDINTGWVNFATFAPSTPNGQATAANGTELLSSMPNGPQRYFDPSWSRDFFTMSAR